MYSPILCRNFPSWDSLLEITLAVSSWHKVNQHTRYRKTCHLSPWLGPRLWGLRQWLSQGYLHSCKALSLPINLAPPEFLLGKEIQGYSSSLYGLMLLRVAQRLDLNWDEGVQWEADMSADIWFFSAQKYHWRGWVHHSDLAWMPSIEPVTPTSETTLLGTGTDASIGGKSTFLPFPHWWHKALCHNYSILSYSLWFSCLEWPEAEYLPNVIWMCQVFQYMLLNLTWKPLGRSLTFKDRDSIDGFKTVSSQLQHLGIYKSKVAEVMFNGHLLCSGTGTRSWEAVLFLQKQTIRPFSRAIFFLPMGKSIRSSRT